MQQQHGATARPFGDAVVGNVRRGPSIGGIFTFRLSWSAHGLARTKS